MITKYFKSIIDADNQPVVICNLENEIIYMNPVAVKRYEKWGGAYLVGRNIFDCHNPQSVRKMQEVVEWFRKDKNNNVVYTFHNTKGDNDYDVYMIALRDENGELMGYYEKHENRIHESMKLYDLGQEGK